MVSEELVVLVDEHDQILGVEEKIKAHRLALLHRAFSVFVYRKENDQVEFLLQQRHSSKYHCGGLWTNTCCSHPRPGENILMAGRRRLKEEMSIDLPLKKLGTFQYKVQFENGLSEHELDHVLIGEYDHAQTITLDPKEVEDFRWVTAEQIKRELSLNPKQYTPWFKPALHLVLEELCINF